MRKEDAISTEGHADSGGSEEGSQPMKCIRILGSRERMSQQASLLGKGRDKGKGSGQGYGPALRTKGQEPHIDGGQKTVALT